MIFHETDIRGAYLIEAEPKADDRGYFARVFCLKEFGSHGIDFSVAQSNVSFSKDTGTLRGLHYQKAPYAESKLVRCSQGALFDVIVDIRPDSPSFMRWVGFELTETNNRMLLAPKGTAHGFLTLCGDTLITYLTSEFYTPSHEAGIRWDDPAFAIEWPATVTIISDKDRSYPPFRSGTAGAPSNGAR